jgi:hypothetical protein
VDDRAQTPPARLLLRAAPDSAPAGRAAWESGQAALIFNPDAAAKVRAARDAPAAVLNCAAFVTPSGFDQDGFIAAVRLCVVALEIEGGGERSKRNPSHPLALGLAGVHEALAAAGLSYSAPNGRAWAASLTALAAAAAYVASAELAISLGPCPAFARDGFAVRLALEQKRDAARTLDTPLAATAAALFDCALRDAGDKGLRNLQILAGLDDPQLSAHPSVRRPARAGGARRRSRRGPDPRRRRAPAGRRAGGDAGGAPGQGLHRP